MKGKLCLQSNSHGKLRNQCCLQGYGISHYDDGSYYEGEWHGGKRSGHGRMFFKDGTFYEGQWYNDKFDGVGLFLYGTYLFIISITPKTLLNFTEMTSNFSYKQLEFIAFVDV